MSNIPTESGFYPARFKHDGRWEVVNVLFEKDDGTPWWDKGADVWVAGNDMVFNLNEFTAWGPRIEMPKEEEDG